MIKLEKKLQNFKDDLIEYKCLHCNKNYQHKFDEKLKERFFNANINFKYKCSNHGNNKFILLLRKRVYSYEYTDDWKKLNETSLAEKEDFYNQLNMEDITDADYTRTKRDCKDFEAKNLGEYHDFYFQRDTLLLTDVFENFRNTYLEIYELDPANFFSAPGLAWQAALKKTEAKLDLGTDIGMLLMVEKGIRGGICRSIYRYGKANNKYMKDYDKNKELSYIQYLDVNNLYDWAMVQKLPVNKFEWIPLNTLKNYMNFVMNIKTSINGLILKTVHRAIIFNQNTWLKPLY